MDYPKEIYIVEPQGNSKQLYENRGEFSEIEDLKIIGSPKFLNEKVVIAEIDRRIAAAVEEQTACARNAGINGAGAASASGEATGLEYLKEWIQEGMK